MVAAVRSGQSFRAVAGQFSVSPATVRLWFRRAQGLELSQVNWVSRSHAPHAQALKTPEAIEQRILDVRTVLAKQSDLGEYGAKAIRDHLLAQGDPVVEPPSVATINRILRRRGLFDSRRRVRRPAPAPGWYLPDVVAGRSEVDEADFVEALFLEAGKELCVLNLVSLHGGWPASWLSNSMRASFVRERLVAHWREFGLPGYAQFDNGNVFAGPRQYPDTIGTVVRLCLSLGVVPIFSVPREFGVQSAIESYNGMWQEKVWHRFHYDNVDEAVARSDGYVSALRAKRGPRFDASPARRAFPDDWEEPARLPRTGSIVLLRRTTGSGTVNVLGRPYEVGAHWCNRLVRCEVDLTADSIRFYGLRRQAPEDQPILKVVPYRLPDKSRKLAEQML